MLDSLTMLAFFGPIGPLEILIVGIVAVLLFGSRLPSVARSLGKSIVEFKKGMHDIENDLKSSIYSEPTGRVSYNKPAEPTAAAPGEPQHTDAASP